jgi:hypothetical protein
MNRIEITILKPQAALDTFAETWRRVEAGEEAKPRLAFGSLNVRQLAEGLGRNYKNVHTDVRDLVELGLLEKSDQGRLTAPFDEIVIHAELRDVA